MRLERRLRIGDLALERGDHGVAQLTGALEVTVARRSLKLALGVIDAALEILHVVDGVLLVQPAGLLHVQLLLDLGDFLAQGLQALLRSVVGLLHEGLLLDLHLGELTGDGVDFHRHGIKLHAQAACGLVHQVDGLIGQEAVGDVAIRKVRRRHQGAVRDVHAVEDLVLLLKAAQNRDGVLHGRLADHNLLETTGQRRVLLDVLAILVQRGSANGM